MKLATEGVGARALQDLPHPGVGDLCRAFEPLYAALVGVHVTGQRPLLRDLRQEEFHALLLNTQHRIIRDVLVTRGILDASLIHPREVFRTAIVESAAALNDEDQKSVADNLKKK